MTKLKSKLDNGTVVHVLTESAAMDVFSLDDKLIRTVLVFSATLYRPNEYEKRDFDVFQVQNELNGVNYILNDGTSVTRSSEDGSISFTNRGQKYKIRAIEDSDGFVEAFEL